MWDIQALERIAGQRTRGGADDAYWGIEVEAMAEKAVADDLERNMPSLSEMAYGLARAPSDHYAVFSGPVDAHTCPLCASLVGMTVRVDSEEYGEYTPPLHAHCRHYWLYIPPEADGARTRWTPPPREMVKRYGHFVTRPDQYTHLKVPATPSQRDFVVKTAKDGSKRVVFAPDPHLDDEVRKTLKRINREMTEGKFAKGISRRAFEHWAEDPAVQKLQQEGLIRVEWTWSDARAREEVVGRTRAAVEKALAENPQWLNRRVVDIQRLKATEVPGGKKVCRWMVSYNTRDTAKVRLTRKGRTELEGQRLD